MRSETFTDSYDNKQRKPRRGRAGIEWPTLLVAGTIYAGFGLATWFSAELPWWLLMAVGGYLVAWHGSLQHEVVHGHPTRIRWLNELLVLPSLWLWIPYGIYRESHLAHHRDSHLTDPLADPESYYVTAETWQKAGRMGRALLWLRNTLAGRLLLGPLVAIWQLYGSEIRLLLRGDGRHLGAWAMHLVGCALVLTWVIGVCGLSFGGYLLLFVLPGLALSQLRSFVEHRADRNVARRTAIVECHPLWSLLFLNNNLHVIHHAEPGAPWYRLPEIFRRRRAHWLARNGGYHFDGYSAVARQHLLRPTDLPLHPTARPNAPAPAAGHRLVTETAPASPVD